MYALVIGRAFPREQTGMMGIFEYEQASALNKYGMKTVYAFCDTRSIKGLKKLNYEQFVHQDVPVYGYHYPIGGMPKKVFNHLKYIKYKKMFKRIFETHGMPGVIHIHFPLLTLNDQIFDELKKLNIPIVVTEHWTKVQTNDLEEHRRKFLNRIVNESDKFIVVGKLLKSSVLSITSSKKKIEIIPNMIKDDFYYNDNILLITGEINIISIGRLVKVKRMDFLIEAFNSAFRTVDNIKLHIVGDGPLYNLLEKDIKSLGLERKVILHGFLPRGKTAEMLQMSDVYVSASSLETFGVPFIEAMACGKRVIGAKGGPVDEYIIENGGDLFEVSSSEDLSKSLIKMVENVNDVNSEEISQKILNKFSEEAISKRLIDVYEYLINQ